MQPPSVEPIGARQEWVSIPSLVGPLSASPWMVEESEPDLIRPALVSAQSLPSSTTIRVGQASVSALVERVSVSPSVEQVWGLVSASLLQVAGVHPALPTQHSSSLVWVEEVSALAWMSVESVSASVFAGWGPVSVLVGPVSPSLLAPAEAPPVFPVPVPLGLVPDLSGPVPGEGELESPPRVLGERIDGIPLLT